MRHYRSAETTIDAEIAKIRENDDVVIECPSHDDMRRFDGVAKRIAS